MIGKAFPLTLIDLPSVILNYSGAKKDFSTAIMDRKKAPHKLQVEDSKIDDNSVVEMTQAKMDELKIFKGDTVILKGKFNASSFDSLFKRFTLPIDSI